MNTKPTIEGLFAWMHSENKRLGLDTQANTRNQPTPTDGVNAPRKFMRFFCTPCDMEREHINAEGYWNCVACGASLFPIQKSKP